MPAQMQIESVPLADALGAEVHGIDLSVPLSGETVAAIRQTWLDHQVLVFRNQHLTDAQLTDFSRHFGDLDTEPGWEPISPSGHPEVLIISNVRKDGATIGVLGDGEASWHTDMSYLDQPPPGSLLYSLEVPDTGGDTCFMSMYAALDALPTDIREAIRGKSLNHDSSHDSAGNLRSNHTAFEDVSGAPGAQHPIVRFSTPRRLLHL